MEGRNETKRKMKFSGVCRVDNQSANENNQKRTERKNGKGLSDEMKKKEKKESESLIW